MVLLLLHSALLVLRDAYCLAVGGRLTWPGGMRGAIEYDLNIRIKL